jgi:hypothetical protein
MEEPSTSLATTISRDQCVETTLVELIIAASECSEDEYEVADLVDTALASGRVELAPEPDSRTPPQDHADRPDDELGDIRIRPSISQTNPPGSSSSCISAVFLLNRSQAPAAAGRISDQTSV